MYKITTGTTFQDHIQAENLEKEYLPSEMIASAPTTWAWGQKNAEGLFLLRQKDSQKLLGHLSAFPVRKEISKALISGEMNDTELHSSAVLPYGSNTPSDFYFSVICVHKAHRFTGA
ncbi:MAG: hypothetical protein PHD48_03765 [Alphaproteobacteria bacterium]|nr:hypothetical protein [Alphaproteobacteria bacterium]